jgi:peptide/nickel transport system substrate-binding protein
MRILALVALLLVSCTASGPARPLGTTGSGSAPADARAAPQRTLVLAISTEPGTLDPGQGSGSGNQDYARLANAALAYVTPQHEPMPYLAEVLPTIEKGTWKVFQNGRMETTYQLRPNATWHDGVPVTAPDFVFAHRVRLDPDTPSAREVDRRISSARALDDRTLLLEWESIYLWGGMLFGSEFSAMPRHALEAMYLTDKESFINGPHWREQYIGNGPYRVERWDPGVEIAFRAHDGFALGKPPIEQLRVQFIADANGIVANLLAGSVHASFHSSIGFPQNQALEQAGWDGTTEYWRGNPRFLEFQMRDFGNHQRAVLDLRVRRALLHAIDRQGIVEGLYAGKARVQHFWLAPDDPAFPAVDRAVTKYEYNPARAEALLGEAGWTKGSDGIARNADGQALDMPMLNGAAEMDQVEATAVVNQWKAIGVPSDIHPLTRTQQRDGEYRSKFRAVAYNRRGIAYDDMVWLTPRLSAAENRWSGQNRSGYVNPELDRLWPKATATIDAKEREGLLIEALKIMTADAAVTPTHLQPQAMAFRAGLVGPKQPWVNDSAQIWNPWEWRWQS